MSTRRSTKCDEQCAEKDAENRPISDKEGGDMDVDSNVLSFDSKFQVRSEQKASSALLYFDPFISTFG